MEIHQLDWFSRSPVHAVQVVFHVFTDESAVLARGHVVSLYEEKWVGRG